MNNSWRLREELDFSTLFEDADANSKTVVIPSRALLTAVQLDLLRRCAGEQAERKSAKGKPQSQSQSRLRVLRFSHLTPLPLGLLRSVMPRLSSLRVFEVVPMAGLIAEHSMLAELDNDLDNVEFTDELGALLAANCPLLEVVAEHVPWRFRARGSADHCVLPQHSRVSPSGLRWEGKQPKCVEMAEKWRNLEVLEVPGVLFVDALATHCRHLTQLGGRINVSGPSLLLLGVLCGVLIFRAAEQLAELARANPGLKTIKSIKGDGLIDAFLLALVCT